MALYARTLLTRDTLRAFSFSFVYLFTLSPSPIRCYSSFSTAPCFHRRILSSPMHPLRSHISSFSNFPRWRHRPLCFFLDTVKRLNATTNPLRFLPHFLSLLRSLICRNSTICYRDATQRRKREIGFRRVFC